MKSKVAIIGVGLVGSGWAIVFARAGYQVALFDAMAGASEKALHAIGDRVKDLYESSLIAEPPGTVLNRISIASGIDEALREVCYVQESVLENIDVKRDVFTQMQPFLPQAAWVGSSSSGIPASRYSDHVAFRDRCLVAHPVNPPYLARIVELVPTPWTSRQTLAGVRELMLEIAQAPIELSREIEGFVLNRLQAVLLMEAWRLVEDGVVTVEDVDLTVSQGLGLRWAFMGPFETIDLNAPSGIADYAARLGPLYRDIAASTLEHRPWSAELVSMVEKERRQKLDANDLESRRRWRDRRLMALAAHMRDMEAREGAAAER